MRADERGRPIHANGTPFATIRDKADLDRALSGQRVCATSGSTSIGIIKKELPHAIPYEVSTRPECLMALQDGAVDAISTHDTFLLGFQRQPNTTILAPELNDQPYGIAINQQHPEFVLFVNGVLQQLRASKQLEMIYTNNFVNCTACRELDAPKAPPTLRRLEWFD